MSKADLHMHSTASDGGYSPSDLMHKCKKAGLSIVSLTDHDSTEGIAEAKETASSLQITIINGIELSTKAQNKNVHMLGYGIDINHQELQDVLAEQRILREKRLHSILQKLKDVDISLKPEDVTKHTDGGSIGRPHIAKALIEKGFVHNMDEAFAYYLAEGKPCYVEKAEEMTPLEAIQLIHRANGLAVVAHPVYYNLDNEIEQWIHHYHLDGVEIYHRDHNEETVLYYEEKMKIWEVQSGRKLLRTGGSDFHHEEYGRHPEPLGVSTISERLALELLEAIPSRDKS
ncbi:PHP domain-containing protein [Alteribacillus iranensis]|uniref:Polymerase/histidinol phosphatase N-terminal domain-containing protein n=1 Tax=Alteribacillus iranensis TaxID=930128 RepID=A0A1I1ZZ31_9BACI|nr:PHP domain-containing protein [Alteribacillus iranensis]SFE36962.1 hypothetical protein SAMN05192532_101549 [Alteribacillus iranensis]